jgi:hypothetical protein
MSLTRDNDVVQHSRRIDPISRSAKPFCLDADSDPHQGIAHAAPELAATANISALILRTRSAD